MLLLASGATSADPESWMKKARPNELGLSAQIGAACPGSRHQYERTILAAFGREWLTPIAVKPNEIFLHVEIWCAQGRTLDPFTVHAEFAQFVDAYTRHRSMGPGYDAHGAGPLGKILVSIDAVVRSALSDHIAANFDL